jgi:hypothetical protein
MSGVSVKPEFYRTPTEETAVLLRSQLHAQEVYFLQREEDWKSDLRESMDREEQFRVRLRELDTEVNIRANSLAAGHKLVALSVEVEQHRQRVQELEGEVQSLVARLEEANSDAVKVRLAEVGCDWAGCSDHRNGAWRFCKLHLDAARKELVDGGYLQSVPWRGGGKRTPEMMEDVYETKNGPME